MFIVSYFVVKVIASTVNRTNENVKSSCTRRNKSKYYLFLTTDNNSRRERTNITRELFLTNVKVRFIIYIIIINNYYNILSFYFFPGSIIVDTCYHLSIIIIVIFCEFTYGFLPLLSLSFISFSSKLL